MGPSTVCFLKTIPSANCVLWEREIVFIKRVYAKGTVFMKPAVYVQGVPQKMSLAFF